MNSGAREKGYASDATTPWVHSGKSALKTLNDRVLYGFAYVHELSSTMNATKHWVVLRLLSGVSLLFLLILLRCGISIRVAVIFLFLINLTLESAVITLFIVQ